MANKTTKLVRGKPFEPGCKAGPGRPPGKLNKTTCDLRDVRREIVESWERCDGPKLLDKLAETDPVAYLKLVIAVLPKPPDAVEALPSVKIIITNDAPPMKPELLADPDAVRALPVNGESNAGDACVATTTTTDAMAGRCTRAFKP